MKAKHFLPIFLFLAVGCNNKPASEATVDTTETQTTPASQSSALTNTGDVIDMASMGANLGPSSEDGMPLPPSAPNFEGDASTPGLPPLPGNDGQLDLPGLPELSEDGQIKLPGLPPLPGEGDGNTEDQSFEEGSFQE
jgi:hypothetical protein